MPDPVSIGVGIVSNVLGGIFGSSKEKKRRAALAAGRDRGNAAWDSSYNDINAMYQPYRDWGTAAGGRLDAASEGDMSVFNKSAGYQFRKDEGMRDVGNYFSGKGGGGNAMRALAEFNSGLASQEYGNWWDRQSGVADRGMAATAGTGAASQNAAAGKSRNEMIAAGGIGASHSNEGQIINNAMTAGVGNYLYGKQRGYWGGDEEVDYVGTPPIKRRA